MQQSKTRHIVFCMFHDQPLFSLISAVEILRHANRWYETPVYKWSFITENDNRVMDSTGLALQPTTSLKDIQKPDRIFLVAGFDPGQISAPRLCRWLKSYANDDVVIGGISNGGFILAAAGLLDDYFATVHWEDFSSFCELYPKVHSRYQRFVVDRNRMTCSGGATTIDLFIELVRIDHGHDVALHVSRQMLLQEVITTTDQHGKHVFNGSHRYSAKVQRALCLLDAGVEEGMNVEALAERVGLGRRQLLRLFRKETGHTPLEILDERRLERARSLVLHSHLPLISIANAVGFSSQSHMTKRYRERFTVTPSKDRRNIHSNENPR